MSYSRIHSEISDSKDWAALVKSAPLCACVYAMAWTACDPYAIIPGGPLGFAGRVCPLLGLSEGKAERVLSGLIERGHVVHYELDGHEYNYLPAWHKHQYVQWDRVGAPQNPLPECWTMPEDLRLFLEAGHGSKPMRAYFSQEAPSHLRLISAPTQILSEYSQSTSGELHSDTLNSDSVKDLLPETPPASPPPKRPVTLSHEELMAKGDAVLATLPENYAEAVETFLANAAAENKTGKMAPGRRLTLLTEIRDAMRKVGPDPLLYGLLTANKKCIPNVNYAKRAAGSFEGWTGQAQRLLPTVDPLEDQYLHPEGVDFGPDIYPLKLPWVEWAESSRNGDRERRYGLMGAAIRKALVDGDYTELKAGPPA